jgi:methionine-rich copper-binding protein CopC
MIHSRVCALAALLCLGLTGPAFAHAHLTSAVPAENGTVTATPSTLRLKFSEGLELRFTGIKVTGPDGAAVPTGDAALGQGDNTSLVVPVPTPLKPGAYTVDWHALSTDGHTTKGRYSFTVGQ